MRARGCPALEGDLPAATPAASAVKNFWAVPSWGTSRAVNISWPLPICLPRSSAKCSGDGGQVLDQAEAVIEENVRRILGESPF